MAVFKTVTSHSPCLGGFPGGSVVRNPPANAGNVGSSLVQEDPLEKEEATGSSIAAWEIPWTEEEPGGLYSTGRKESDTAEHACTPPRHSLSLHLSYFSP